MLTNNYQAFLKSQEILYQNFITDFPLNIIKLIESYDIILQTLDDYQEFRSITKESRDYIKISDGRSFYDPTHNIYMIVYDSSKKSQRIRFTLAHELGHILLGHLKNELTQIDRGGISNSLYQNFENEADTFAGNLLAPPILILEKIKNISHFSSSIVCKSFALSFNCVEYYRKKDFTEWIHKNISSAEKHILYNYRNRLYPLYCSVCRTQIFGKNFLFCPICGNSLIKGRGNKNMLYSRIDLNEHNKAKICPKCGNEDILQEGEYCQICGCLLVNKCLQDCNLPFDNDDVSCCSKSTRLPGNARYCPYCGSETSFLTQGILKPWNAENKDISLPSSNLSAVDSDDELPF